MFPIFNETNVKHMPDQLVNYAKLEECVGQEMIKTAKCQYFFQHLVKIKIPHQASYAYEIFSTFENWNLSKSEFYLLLGNNKNTVTLSFASEKKWNRAWDTVYTGNILTERLRNLFTIFECNEWDLKEAEQFLLKNSLVTSVIFSIRVKRSNGKTLHCAFSEVIP